MLPTFYNFYPGPSKTDARCPEWFAEACASGIAYANHRSSAFEQLYADTKVLLRQRLHIPAEYEICLLSSATQAWQSTLLSYPHRRPTHVYNGAFGEKWAKMSQSLGLNPQLIPFAHDEMPPQTGASPQLLCLVHNETSNGTALSSEYLHHIRITNPQALIVADAVSSMAGVDLPWTDADIWLASVQKCFGLPAGMALLVCSPRAAHEALEANSPQYDAVHRLVHNAGHNQTIYTPNVSGLYLLSRRMLHGEDITVTEHQLRMRKQQIDAIFTRPGAFSHLSENAALQSTTVCVYTGSVQEVRKLHEKALQLHIVLGNGYGTYSAHTFRIANFPAIPDGDYNSLTQLINE